MAQKIVITRAGHEALTEAEIKEYIFHSDYNTFKILAEGSLSAQAITANPTTLSVAHGKSYTPAVMAFIKYPDGYVTLPGGVSRADFSRRWEVEVDGTNIYFVVYKGGGTSPYVQNVPTGVEDATLNTDTDGYFKNADDVVIGKTASSTHYSGCFRFTNVGIPKGATITDASILVHENGNNGSYGDTTPTVKAVVSCVDEDNTASFTNSPFGRTKTTAHVHWVHDFNNTDGEEHTISGLASLVQEVIDRAGWVSGNAIGFIADNDGSSTSNCGSIYAYEASTERCPKLTITYTVPNYNVDVKYYTFEAPSNS
jgi:hypothetical protein